MKPFEMLTGSTGTCFEVIASNNDYVLGIRLWLAGALPKLVVGYRLRLERKQGGLWLTQKDLDMDLPAVHWHNMSETHASTMGVIGLPIPCGYSIASQLAVWNLPANMYRGFRRIFSPLEFVLTEGEFEIFVAERLANAPYSMVDGSALPAQESVELTLEQLALQAESIPSNVVPFSFTPSPPQDEDDQTSG